MTPANGSADTQDRLDSKAGIIAASLVLGSVVPKFLIALLQRCR